MAGRIRIGGRHTVVVTVRGVVLDQASFADKAGADLYKRGVRRWAFQRGVLVEVWDQGLEAHRRTPADQHLWPAAGLRAS